jgi:TonB family protein
MFVESLIESRAHPWDIRRAAALPLVVGIHLLVLGVLTISSIWRITYLEEAPISVSVVGAIPPGVPGPSTQVGSKDQGPRETAIPRDSTAPIEMPAWEPVVLTGQDDTPGDPGWEVDGGVIFGDAQGGPGPWSDLSGRLPGDIPRKPQEPEILIVDNITVMAPVRLMELQPCYTEAARKAGIQGTVVLQLTISRQGMVENVSVLRGLSMGLTDCAVEAARKQRFKPAFRSTSGEPVACLFTLTVFFRLN